MARIALFTIGMSIVFYAVFSPMYGSFPTTPEAINKMSDQINYYREIDPSGSREWKIFADRQKDIFWIQNKIAKKYNLPALSDSGMQKEYDRIDKLRLTRDYTDEQKQLIMKMTRYDTEAYTRAAMKTGEDKENRLPFMYAQPYTRKMLFAYVGLFFIGLGFILGTMKRAKATELTPPPAIDNEQMVRNNILRLAAKLDNEIGCQEALNNAVKRLLLQNNDIHGAKKFIRQARQELGAWNLRTIPDDIRSFVWHDLSQGKLADAVNTLLTYQRREILLAKANDLGIRPQVERLLEKTDYEIANEFVVSREHLLNRKTIVDEYINAFHASEENGEFVNENELIFLRGLRQELLNATELSERDFRKLAHEFEKTLGKAKIKDTAAA